MSCPTPVRSSSFCSRGPCTIFYYTLTRFYALKFKSSFLWVLTVSRPSLKWGCSHMISTCRLRAFLASHGMLMTEIPPLSVTITPDSLLGSAWKVVANRKFVSRFLVMVSMPSVPHFQRTERSFSVCRPYFWNKLPHNIRTYNEISSLKMLL